MATCTRHHRPGLLRAVQASLVLLLVAVPSAASSQEFLDAAHPLHARLAEELTDGRTSRPAALMTALRAVFAPDELRFEYAGLATTPLRCATPLLRAVDGPLSGLPAVDRIVIDAWRERSATRRATLTHVSPGGRFEITYQTTGPDSVNITDISPANGVPDYVDQVAAELEFSWTTEVDQLGFDAPDTGGLPYEIELLAIGSFGYAELDAMAPGGTRIVLRNNYEGVPDNEDPEGSEIGALRVTAAHEFRHAGQYATSGWSEAGLWVEVNAVWIEDHVYDDVNDYYRYLASSSPISDPHLPLDDGGSPSYPENVFDHWIEARLGVTGIQEVWERRRAMPGEETLLSYDHVLTPNFAPLDSAFVDFALFNLQTGALAAPGAGYTEAAGYPDARIAQAAGALPAAFGSAIEHLAAKFYRIDGFSAGNEEVQLRLRQAGGPLLQLAALTIRKDGVRIERALPMSSSDGNFRLDTPAADIEELYLVVANGNGSGPAAWFFADVEEVPPVTPDPVITLDGTRTSLLLAVGQTKHLSIGFNNDGPPSSLLEYTAWATDPGGAARGIENSTLSIDQLSYSPGETGTLSIGVLNGGSALGFISRVALTIPAGVNVASGGNIVSEGGSPLTYLGVDPLTSSVQWLDLDGGLGAIPSGGTGLGQLRLTFPLSMTGPVVLDWTLEGDGFGGGQQEVTGQIVLTGPVNPPLELRCPDPMPPAVVGETTDVLWLSAEPGPIKIELSRDDGQVWETLVESTANDGHWQWMVDGPTSSTARLRVTANGQDSAPSLPFDILQVVPWATMVPSTGTLAGSEGLGLLLRVDATGLVPGIYPVRVDVRDANTDEQASVDITVSVVASPVDAPPVARTQVFGVHPNPFNPSTELRFQLATGARVEAEILDLRGRRVRRLISADLPAGPHSARWDGLDADGHAVASGTYVWRLRTGGRQFTGKLSLVR